MTDYDTTTSNRLDPGIFNAFASRFAVSGEQVTEYDIADQLGVTVEVLRNRLRHATPAEVATLTMEVANTWDSAA